MNRLALFDCDGTLVDSQHNIVVAMERAFAAEGLPVPDRAAVRGIIGLSLPQAIAALLPHTTVADQDHLSACYKRAFWDMRAGGEVDEPLFDGIADLLAALDADGWLLGVATGKSDRGLAHCLSAHGIAQHFVTLQTADRHPSKPDPAMLHAAMAEAGAAPETTVMIGDTSFDMAMARSGGAVALGVGWGYHDADTLVAAGAHAVAMDSAALSRHIAGHDEHRTDTRSGI